ncbi:hypothetical protein V6N13_016755 [Hibiscus sabdariffa]
MDFGKLLRAQTNGREDVIVRYIARFFGLLNSSRPCRCYSGMLGGWVLRLNGRRFGAYCDNNERRLCSCLKLRWNRWVTRWSRVCGGRILSVATYAPCGAVEQGACWRSLSVLISSCGLPVYCGGDFNSVLSVEERRYCLGNRRGMVVFLDFVEVARLLDLPASGCKYTWHGSESKASRLDRFLVSVPWIEKFVDLVQHNLPPSISDHSLVRLSSGVTDWGPRPFHFLNCWLEMSAHVRLMGAEWRRISEEAHSPVSFMDKLRSLKSFLKVWNRVSFGSVDLQIVMTEELLKDLDEQGDLRMAPEDLAMTRRQLHGNLWRLLKYRASIWGQKSRALWLRDGDRNTKFFQQSAKIRGTFNHIQGQWIN